MKHEMAPELWATMKLRRWYMAQISFFFALMLIFTTSSHAFQKRCDSAYTATPAELCWMYKEQPNCSLSILEAFGKHPSAYRCDAVIRDWGDMPKKESRLSSVASSQHDYGARCNGWLYDQTTPLDLCRADRAGPCSKNILSALNRRSGSRSIDSYCQEAEAKSQQSDELPPHVKSCGANYSNYPNEKLCELLKKTPQCQKKINEELFKSGSAGVCERMADAKPRNDESDAPKFPSRDTEKKRAAASYRPTSSGSSFLISSNKLITNAHVTDGCNAIGVVQGDSILFASEIDRSKSMDLSLLSVEEPLGVAPKRRTSARLGEDIVAAGYPFAQILSKSIKITSGEVSSTAGIGNDATRLQISAPIQPGNSGGPIFDMKGNVVGVSVAKLDDKRMLAQTGSIAQNVNFAIKPEILKMFLDANNIVQTGESNKKLIQKTEVAEIAKKSTFKIICLTAD